MHLFYLGYQPETNGRAGKTESHYIGRFHFSHHHGRKQRTDNKTTAPGQGPQTSLQGRQAQYQLQILRYEYITAESDKNADHIGQQRSIERGNAEQFEVYHRMFQFQLPAY